MVRMAENGERKNLCKECGKGFKSKSKLQQHGTVHTKLKLFVCDVAGCEKNYAQVASLNRLKKSFHEGVIHECPECGERFSQNGTMTRHYKTVHLKEKPFKCAKCGLQYGTNSDLQRHLKTVHDKIKDFQCDYCYKSFGQAVERKAHIDSVHSTQSL